MMPLWYGYLWACLVIFCWSFAWALYEDFFIGSQDSKWKYNYRNPYFYGYLFIISVPIVNLLLLAYGLWLVHQQRRGKKNAGAV